ncbi:MAG TPA: hypothetical protein VGP81_05755 [Pyrinomonadaceae bacterium]|jgi:hypothetical protein|nr:hypothetical protein [Pyrinomonadaceae bacterium]
MNVVKQVLGHHVISGGESHSGWLPKGAAVPKPMPTSDVALDITIEFDGGGYLLCWRSSASGITGDLWYQTLDDAERGAAENFGVSTDEWQIIP